MKNKTRLALIFVTALSVFGAANPSFARVGSPSSSSRPSSSSARPSSMSAPRSAPAPSYSAPSRAGAGSNVGMQRSEAMSQARSAPPSAPPAAYSRPPASYSNQPAAPAPANGYSAGQMAAAGVGGAVVGGILGHAMTNTTPNNGYNNGYNNGSGGTVNYQSGASANPNYGAPSTVIPMSAPVQHSSGFGFGSFLLLVAFGFLAFYAYRKYSAAQATGPSFNSSTADYAAAGSMSSSGELSLLGECTRIYNAVQTANNLADKNALIAACTPDVSDELCRQINDRGNTQADSQVIRVEVVNNRVLDYRNTQGSEVGSIHFRSLISENGAPAEEISELWHFTRKSGSSWKLAGIEIM